MHTRTITCACMISIIGIHKRKNLVLKNISRQEMSGNNGPYHKLKVHAVQIARGTKATVHAKVLERCQQCYQGVLGVKAEHVEVSGRGASSEFRGC